LDLCISKPINPDDLDIISSDEGDKAPLSECIQKTTKESKKFVLKETSETVEAPGQVSPIPQPSSPSDQQGSTPPSPKEASEDISGEDPNKGNPGQGVENKDEEDSEKNLSIEREQKKDDENEDVSVDVSHNNMEHVEPIGLEVVADTEEKETVVSVNEKRSKIK
jgi:hypothetical protein